jgi:hypothetical protein
MLYYVACMASIVCMIYYVVSTRIALCTCEIMHYVACIYCIVCTKCTCCTWLHISSACPLTYACAWTGCMGLWVSGVFFVFFVFFYKLKVFYIMVYIEVYFCQSASNFNMTDNFIFIFIFFQTIEDKGNFGLVTSHYKWQKYIPLNEFLVKSYVPIFTWVSIQKIP